MNNENEQVETTSISTEFEYTIRCSCCGKLFITDEPKQDLCRECMNELADFLSLDD